jgi:hypothetical protein
MTGSSEELVDAHATVALLLENLSDGELEVFL